MTGKCITDDLKAFENWNKDNILCLLATRLIGVTVCHLQSEFLCSLWLEVLHIVIDRYAETENRNGWYEIGHMWLVHSTASNGKSLSSTQNTGLNSRQLHAITQCNSIRTKYLTYHECHSRLHTLRVLNFWSATTFGKGLWGIRFESYWRKYVFVGELGANLWMTITVKLQYMIKRLIIHQIIDPIRLTIVQPDIVSITQWLFL